MNPTILHFSAGSPCIDGFVNIGTKPAADLQLELAEPLNWADRSVDGIFCNGVLELLTQAEATRLVHECRRILKPGAKLRVSTADLSQIVSNYSNEQSATNGEASDAVWNASRCERLNNEMRESGRQWIYDENELVKLGRLVGFEFELEHDHGNAADETPSSIFGDIERGQAGTLTLDFHKPDRQLAPGAMPLVSIAIPSYNPRFFEAALLSALSQTYTNIEIVICDDCPNDSIQDIAERYVANDPRIRYIRNATCLGRENFVKCIAEAKGEFIKFLNDDDLLAENCVERMVDCYRLAPDIAMVTSRRQRIDASGKALPEIFETMPPVEMDACIEGLSLGTTLLFSFRNFVGEPSTVFFRAAEVRHVFPDFMSINGHRIGGISDIAAWINLAPKGDIAYLTETLSAFRIHAQQAQIEFRDACVALALEGIKIMRATWDRHGLAHAQFVGTIQCKPLNQKEVPWSLRTIRGNCEGWYSPAQAATAPEKDDRASNDLARYVAASRLNDEGKTDEAIADLIQQAEAGSACWQVYNDLGTYAFQSGDITGAISLLQQAATLEPHPRVANLNLAIAQVANTEWDAAQETLTRHLQHNPDDPDALELRNSIKEKRVPTSHEDDA